MKEATTKRENLTGIAFLRTVFVLLLALSLAGCSGGNSELAEENEKLRAELDAANESLEAVDSKIEELESKLNAAETEQAEDPAKATTEESKVVAEQPEIIPPKSDSKQLLTGEWFYQGFHEEGIFSFTQTLVFHTDGTGTMNRRYYIPKSEIEEIKNSPVSLPDIDTSAAASWALDGNAVHITLDNGETADFTFLPEQQQLQMINGNDKYGKEKPNTMEQYVERALYAEDIQAKEAARIRRFLGMWYFDVLTWTFNEDGTGVIDIPKLGDQPATTRKFTYSVSDDLSDPTYLCLTLDWEDGRTSYFYPEFKTDGSVSLKGFDDSETMMLTRQFDANNCPISKKIIANEFGVLSGSMFSEILPE